MVMCGFPMNKAEKMRPWIEAKCKQSLTHSSHLKAHIPKLLKAEELLQETILAAVKHISIIFDATPRQGDLFALIARFVSTDPEKRKAVCQQQLIHLAAVKGSLDAMTQAGVVTNGLQDRRCKNEMAVAGINDGCATNGASHNIMNNVAEITKRVQRLVIDCFSHCVNNAGEFVFLSYRNLNVKLILSSLDRNEGVFRQR